MSDLVLSPRRGLPDGLVVPEAEFLERFSRSSGPGGQGVNTTDSRVELRWDVAGSPALTDVQRAQVLTRLAPRITGGELILFGSEHRSQRQNRTAVRARLTMLLADALAPPPPARRATRPSRAAKQRRIEEKKRRGQIKANRGRPIAD